MEEFRVRKNDLRIGLLIVLAALLMLAVRMLLPEEEHARVRVIIDGREDVYYSLDEDQQVTLNDGTNTMQIKDGVVTMIQADCPDKLCMHQKPISKTDESIICLPNRVVLTVEGAEEAQVDAVAK